MTPAPEVSPLPDLPEPYASALREAVAFITARYAPLGLIAAGSVLRGQGSPSSDLDLYVIHTPPWRQRVQRWFNGVPAEIFVNPPAAIARYFVDEQRAARPITAHMLATGFVLIRRDPVVDDLRAQAQALLAAPPAFSEAERTFSRYMAATLVEDGLDMLPGDPAAADLILGQSVIAMLRGALREAGRFIPRDKDLLAAVSALDPVLGDLARAYFSSLPGQRPDYARWIADHTLGTRGFFAWESDPQPVEPPGAPDAAPHPAPDETH